jgi:hypothetical protein
MMLATARVHPSLPHLRPAEGFHRICRYGLLAGGARSERLAQARELLQPASRGRGCRQ